MRSGDGWESVKAFSVICYPGSFDASGPYDNDAKGSPDGTKIAFVSNYDLKNGPATETKENVSKNADRIPVQSTIGFPKKGRLVMRSGFNREVLGYERITPTSFEELSRGLYGTPASSPTKGQPITSFESRLIPEEQWKNLPLPASYMRNSIKDLKSPLMYQRQSDVYVAVIRLPDRPYLRKDGSNVELIPGENHWETYGYHIFQDGKKITGDPLLPGTSFTLERRGTYTAVSVEWSGLESKKSMPLKIDNSMTLKILLNKPADFSLIYDRWLVNGEKVSQEVANRSEEAVKEIVHIYDGIIHTEWYNWGQITRRYDLNLEGKPIRRLFYQNGKLARRELHHRDGRHVSTELFDLDGYITEAIQYRTVNGKIHESNHWWYEKAVPVKNIKGGAIYEKDGSRWIKKIIRDE